MWVPMCQRFFINLAEIMDLSGMINNFLKILSFGTRRPYKNQMPKKALDSAVWDVHRYVSQSVSFIHIQIPITFITRALRRILYQVLVIGKFKITTELLKTQSNSLLTQFRVQLHLFVRELAGFVSKFRLTCKVNSLEINIFVFVSLVVLNKCK